MSYMPNIGTQVELKDNRVAWVSQITLQGNDDRVIFEDGHEEKVLPGDFAKVGEEPPDGFDYPEAQRILNNFRQNERKEQGLWIWLRRLRATIRKEEENQECEDQPTDFMKWWHAYKLGAVDTMEEATAQTAWNAAQDTLLTRIEKKIND
jgi:hypothetical protein